MESPTLTFLSLQFLQPFEGFPTFGILKPWCCAFLDFSNLVTVSSPAGFAQSDNERPDEKMTGTNNSKISTTILLTLELIKFSASCLRNGN
jgi:hypothetical protein